jgi:hypothetical protein
VVHLKIDGVVHFSVDGGAFWCRWWSTLALLIVVQKCCNVDTLQADGARLQHPCVPHGFLQ